MIWAASVALVATPGLVFEAHVPLVEAIEAEGHTVEVVQFPCANQSAEELAVRLADRITEKQVVVAHGLGATLALMAAPKRQAARYVLIAPVLGVLAPAGSQLRRLSEREVGATVKLTGGEDVWKALVGSVPEAQRGCVPAPFARDVQGWIRSESIPLALDKVTAPVWMAVSLGDDVSTVETTVPAARALPDYKMVRLGVGRFGSSDHDHADMLHRARKMAAEAIAPD